MTRRPPGDRSHLERLLNIWSNETGNVTAGRLRNVVGVTVIAQMLDGLRSADGKHLFVFKGGAGLQMRYGLRSRATRDLDAASRAEMDTVVERIATACVDGRDDAASFQRRTALRSGCEHPGEHRPFDGWSHCRRRLRPESVSCRVVPLAQ